MKVSELIKKIKRIGCYITDHGKEHDEWYSPVTNRYFRVPRHGSKEIATGTANSIMKDAGLK
ncbi:MAG: type II toxin-antitoxin system HicA family toxin [Lachnospiraceae bacterium]|nr:type II toxin-antitoxin system HicA family toxin [Lachnospiraceae bacterium]